MGKTGCEVFQIPNKTALKLCPPDNWTSNISRPRNNLPPTIDIRPKDSNDAYIKITVFWNLNNRKDFNDISKIKETVIKTGNEFLTSAVETTLPLSKTSNNNGYYFSITDKAPKPGEYKHMSQGIMALDKLQLIFTILYNSPNSTGFNTALSVIENAQQR